VLFRSKMPKSDRKPHGNSTAAKLQRPEAGQMSIINAFKRPSATLQRPPLVELSANTPINLERQSFPDLLEDEDGDDEEDAGKEVIDLTGEKDKQMPEFLKVSPRKKSRPALGPTNINVSPQQDQHDQRDVSPDLLEEEDEEEIEVSFQSTESDENEEVSFPFLDRIRICNRNNNNQPVQTRPSLNYTQCAIFIPHDQPRGNSL